MDAGETATTKPANISYKRISGKTQKRPISLLSFSYSFSQKTSTRISGTLEPNQPENIQASAEDSQQQTTSTQTQIWENKWI